VLRSRRPLQTRAFDTPSEWLSVKTCDRLRFEFLSLPTRKRIQAMKVVAAGGSMPHAYVEELERLRASCALRLEVDEGVERSAVECATEGVAVNGDRFALVVLATGVVTAPSSSPLYRSVEAGLAAPTVGGLPHVDSRLRWLPGEDLFVLGASAGLQLGPGCGNLIGAMRGVRVSVPTSSTG
jgi:hypothetical protein